MATNGPKAPRETDLPEAAASRVDREGFEQIVRDHHRSLLALARTLVSGADADEAVQNAWIKAYTAIESFEGRSSLRSWLSRIVINEARMLLRRQGRELKLDDVQSDDGDPLADRFDAKGNWSRPPSKWAPDNPEELMMQDDLQECLERLFETMPANQRALIVMRDMQQISFEEICNELGISASNARVLLHRGRAHVFALVDHYQETGEC